MKTYRIPIKDFIFLIDNNKYQYKHWYSGVYVVYVMEGIKRNIYFLDMQTKNVFQEKKSLQI